MQKANLRTPSGMAAINQISRSLLSVSGVRQVDSATQPTGKVIKQFHLAYQNAQASSGLHQIQNGLFA